MLDVWMFLDKKAKNRSWREQRSDRWQMSGTVSLNLPNAVTLIAQFLMLCWPHNFATIINHMVNICVFWWSSAIPVKGSIDPQRGCDQQLENRWSGLSLLAQLLSSLDPWGPVLSLALQSFLSSSDWAFSTVLLSNHCIFPWLPQLCWDSCWTFVFQVQSWFVFFCFFHIQKFSFGSSHTFHLFPTFSVIMITEAFFFIGTDLNFSLGSSPSLPQCGIHFLSIGICSVPQRPVCCRLDHQPLALLGSSRGFQKWMRSYEGVRPSRMSISPTVPTHNHHCQVNSLLYHIMCCVAEDLNSTITHIFKMVSHNSFLFEPFVTSGMRYALHWVWELSGTVNGFFNWNLDLFIWRYSILYHIQPPGLRMLGLSDSPPHLDFTDAAQSMRWGLLSMGGRQSSDSPPPWFFTADGVETAHCWWTQGSNIQHHALC